MRHIKIYENYSDDELADLLGDMRSVGQSRVNLDIDYGPFKGMGEKDKKEEKDVVDNWSFNAPAGKIEVKSGSIKFSMETVPDQDPDLNLDHFYHPFPPPSHLL